MWAILCSRDRSPCGQQIGALGLGCVARPNADYATIQAAIDAANPGDTVYVTDVNANAIHIVRDGEILEVIGGLGRVHGFSLDSDGALYASDSANRQVLKVTRRP